MKILKINKKDYVIKFTSKVIKELNAQGVTLIGLTDDLQVMKVDNLYTVFYHGLKAMSHDITMDRALEIIDEYFEEDENNDLETFFKLILEEYASAMGLGKKFRETMIQQGIVTE